MALADRDQRNAYLRAWRAWRAANRETYPCAAGCGAVVARRCSRCYACRWGKDAGVAERLDRPWHEDAASREFVDAHPGGALLEDVAVELGLTRERIRQIEAVALRKLAMRLPLVGIVEADVLAMLAGKADDNDRSLVGA